MSEFSHILAQHVHNKNIKTQALAQYCGLDRSNMYKIINGKRKPTSLDIVDKISKFMHLSPIEKEELEEAYQITLAGSENYFRRKEVLNFFSEFTLSPAVLPSFHYDTSLKEQKEISYLNSSAEVKQALFHIISTEMSRPRDGHVCLLIQPDADFLINLLCAESQAEMDICIEHIICLNNNSENLQSQRNYNLNCLKQTLPLYGCFRNYNCFYYYDDVSSKTGALTLFPYMVITSRYVCLLTSGLNKGSLMPYDSSHKMFMEIFEEYMQASTALLKPIKNGAEQLGYVKSLLRDYSKAYCFQMTPCFTPFITIAHAEKYITDIPHRSLFLEQFHEYLKDMAVWNEQKSVSYIFSYDGVKRFLEDGKIDEYSSEICRNFDMQDRIYLIKKLIQACSSLQYHMLRKDIVNPTYELYLFVNQQNGYLMFLSPYNGQPVYFNIEEPGLLFTFYDFCENLDEDMFYTYAETEELLTQLIQK